MTAKPAHDPVLDEQLAYYRARATEYDQWFYRQGRSDHGAEANGVWFSEVAQIERALDEFRPQGRILELACGTGLWTRHLVRYAASLTVVDGSSEMLALNRARLNTAEVRYLEVDLFNWKPDAEYDVVFFGFWLSHVPAERFVTFWNLVRACLAPSGRAFFVDSLFNPAATASGHRLESPDVTVVKRELNDGREFSIYKCFYRPAELAGALRALGWRATVSTTPSHFLYGAAEVEPNR